MAPHSTGRTRRCAYDAAGRIAGIAHNADHRGRRNSTIGVSTIYDVIAAIVPESYDRSLEIDYDVNPAVNSSLRG